MADESTKQGEPEKLDPRETPAFRGVLKQLESERAEKSALADRLRALEDEGSKRRATDERKELEQRGKYEEALSATQRAAADQLAKLEAELANSRVAYERAQITSDLAAHGVTGKARDFLASSYMALENRPALDRWVEAAKTDADYGMFFVKARTPQPGDPGGHAAALSQGRPNWTQVRADLRGPDKKRAAEAQTLMTAYIMEKGDAPPKE